ncbi:MAG: sulfatase [Planctomycetota bacterium]
MKRTTILLALVCTVLGGCGDASRRDAGRNLLLIAVDTLRADHLGAYGYERPTSPAIDRLFAFSIVFEDAHSSSSWTLPAFASLMTSTYSSTHRCWQFDNFLESSFTTLAELMSDAGYHTAAIVSHIFLGRKYGLNQGFVEYDDSLVQSNLEDSHMAITSSVITDRALAFLKRESERSDGRPWFLWTHYFDPHIFYQPHEEFAEQFGRFRPLDRYDGEIAYTDLHIGRLLEYLEESDFAQNTVVVFVADHGEEFMDHGGMEHGKSLFREVERVPFAVRVPGLDPRKVTQPVRGVDLMPTLLDLLDVETGPLPMAGRSLLALMKGSGMPDEGVLMESRLDQLPNAVLEGYILGKWKLILQTPRREDLGKRPAVFLFDRTQDPTEQVNLAQGNDEIVGKLAKLMRKNVNDAADVAHLFQGKGGQLALSADELERLRELGYLDYADPQDEKDGDR